MWHSPLPMSVFAGTSRVQLGQSAHACVDAGYPQPMGERFAARPGEKPKGSSGTLHRDLAACP